VLVPPIARALDTIKNFFGKKPPAASR